MAEKGQMGRGEPRPDRYRVRLRVPDLEALHRLTQRRAMDIHQVHRAPGEPPAAGLEVEAFLELEHVEQLRQDGLELELGPNVSAIGRERQREVARGDRFEGGRVPPRGLGEKVKRDERR